MPFPQHSTGWGEIMDGCILSRYTVNTQHTAASQQQQQVARIVQSAIGNPQLTTTAIDFLACTIFSGTECCAGELDEMIFLLFGQLANSRVESGLSWLHWPLVAGRICGMHSRITRVEALPTHAQPLAGFHFVALRNHWLSQSASKLGIGMGIAFGFCISLYARIYLSIWRIDEPNRRERDELSK